MHLNNRLQRTWIEISNKALVHNLKVLHKFIGKKTEITAVVKANAYGHGLKEVVEILEGKVKIISVDSLSEALEVKMISPNTKVIVLGYIPLDNLKVAIKNEISFVVYNMETLKKIVSSRTNNKALIHLKVETGLNRQGVSERDLKKILKFIKSHQNKIVLEGVSTHFANIGDATDSSFPMLQLSRFKKALTLIKTYGFVPRYVHSAASAGAFLYRDTHFSMVRFGIALYGLWPSRKIKVLVNLKNHVLKLQPVLVWKSIIAQIKNIKLGESVGYGRTWFAARKSRIAVVPVGYSDGFDRRLSNMGKVIINGEFAPVVGRVSMNMITVDITRIKNVSIEDEVILIGSKDGASITVDEIAACLNTINYEVVARINPLIPRIIFR